MYKLRVREASMKRLGAASFSAALLAAVALTHTSLGAADGGSCDALSRLNLMNVKITLAEAIAAGQFRGPGGPGRAGGGAPAADAFSTMPAFCRVAATLTPNSDSDIKVEVWMPQTGWNGKMVGEGNGGWAGVISYAPMADDVKMGYAATSTDTG